MAMTPEERQEFDSLKQRFQDLEDIFNGIKFPSFWEFKQPIITHLLRLPNLAADPDNAVIGQLAVVSEELKVYTSGGWVVVGTQT